MSLKKFIYFIIDDQGRCGQIVNGVVVYLTSPKALPQAPDGNQEISIGWERSAMYFGNVRTFSLDLGALMEFATILRSDWYNNNVDLIRYLLIKKLTYEYTTTTYKEYYKQYYKGQIDFSTINDDQGGFRVNFRLIDGGLQRLLKAHETTVYEIPLDGDAKNITMDGTFITGLFRWFVSAFTDLGSGYPSLFQLPNDNPIPGAAFFDVMMSFNAIPDDDTLEYFMEVTQDIDGVHITGLLTDFNALGSSGPLSVNLYVFNKITNSIRLNIDLTPDDPYPEHYNLVVDETIDLIVGDRLFLRTGSHFLGEGNWNVNAKSKPPDSVITAFTMYDLGRKLIEKITGSADNLESTLLPLQNILYTSIDGVRSIVGAAIKTSWKDYWQEVNVRCMAEMHITDTKIVIEERLNVYGVEPGKVAIELGEVKDLKINDAVDLMATSIKVGNAEQQIDDTNGKYDFNGYMVFNTPIKSIPDKQLDLQSPYKASCYEIEQTRANYEGKTTTDKETDNDVMAIAAVPDVYQNTFDTLGSFFADGTPIAPGLPLLTIVAANPRIVPGMKLRITGTVSNNQDITIASAQPWFFGQLIVPNEALVDEASVNMTIEIIHGEYYALDRSIAVDQLVDPDVDQDIKDSLYNLPLTPKRILMTHAREIAGMLFGYAGNSLVFSSANRNKELISDGLIEKADVPIASLGLPMFRPKYFEFDIISPVDLPEIHESDPSPLFAFLWNMIRYTGFQLRDGIAPNDLEEQTFKLLACPENDLLNLI